MAAEIQFLPTECKSSNQWFPTLCSFILLAFTALVHKGARIEQEMISVELEYRQRTFDSEILRRF
jgi:hypothetical protein